MPTPADIATSGMMVLLWLAAGNFFVKLGLKIFGKSEWSWFADILAIFFIVGMLIFAGKGYMSAADAVNHGKWPQ
jgi:hypothetical protein